MTGTGTLIALIRHGPTDGNGEKRPQGRADRPLSDEGRKEVSGRGVPFRYRSYYWVSSPLARARETAELLSLPVARVEYSIIEMDWGDCEGRTRAELDEKYGAEVAARAA